MSRASRGDIWLADLGMIAKVRPVLVLSVAYQENERAVVTFVGRTTARRGTPYEIPHHDRGMPEGAFDAQGIGTLPDVKLERKLGRIDAGTLNQVEAAVRQWLALWVQGMAPTTPAASRVPPPASG